MAHVMSLMVGALLATACLAAPVAPVNSQANVTVAATFSPVASASPNCADFSEDCQKRNEALKACDPECRIRAGKYGPTGDLDVVVGPLPPLVPNGHLPALDATAPAPKMDQIPPEEYHHGWIEYGTEPGNGFELHPEETHQPLKDDKKPTLPLAICPEDHPGGEPVICIPGQIHPQSPAGKALEEAKRKAREEVERLAREEGEGQDSEEEELQARDSVPELTFPDLVGGDHLPATGHQRQWVHHW